MKVFKFGGASVKNAEAVRNVASILLKFEVDNPVVVISAMGKMTNALEELHLLRFKHKNFNDSLQKIRSFHEEICIDLFGRVDQIPTLITSAIDQLEDLAHAAPTKSFDFEYDEIICFGELISTAIVQSFLAKSGIPSSWFDARQIVRTDNRQRGAKVDWERSAIAVKQLKDRVDENQIIVTQGFIGMGTQNNTTSLGREGSDFTAAILAFLLDAESVTIWKDVPGMLNADPKWLSDFVKLDKISFHEAIELAYYGASVIHPKTIKPLQNKNIPLYIKSFIDPDATGSVIQESTEFDQLVPSYIFKANQVLISITPRDFSFVVEDNLKEIFSILSDHAIRIHMMENSAISFSICIDKDDYKQKLLFDDLQKAYQVRYNENLTLITVRHYDENYLQSLVKDKEIILEQRSRHTVRMIVR